jgi:hypothetical protein
MKRSCVLVALAIVAAARSLAAPIRLPSAAAGADLAVAKVADRATARVGDSVTYTITHTNNGPRKALERGQAAHGV